jgi:hypothetical protein
MKLKWGFFEIKAGFKDTIWCQTSRSISNMVTVQKTSVPNWRNSNLPLCKPSWHIQSRSAILSRTAVQNDWVGLKETHFRNRGGRTEWQLTARYIVIEQRTFWVQCVWRKKLVGAWLQIYLIWCDLDPSPSSNQNVGTGSSKVRLTLRGNANRSGYPDD